MSASRPLATERVRAAYDRIAEVDRPEVWIALRPLESVLAEAAAIDDRVAAGERLQLAGLTLAVKDNIDVAGMPTTAGCPAFAYAPDASAPAVERLVAAGAVVLGKTNLDQFATGLVGTRSPYGAVRDARRPDHVSGGSSSGSAVAVALGVADLALGTDTAGSGRVPAAFQGIVGLKPTRGLVPTLGVVPACRTFDCVSVFARELPEAELAIDLMTGPAPGDPTARAWPPGAPLGAPAAPRVAVPAADALGDLTPAAARAFEDAVAALVAAGAKLVEIDLAPFLEAGRLLYQGAFVAERFAAVGSFVAAHQEHVDPTVGAIIVAAQSIPAHALVADLERLDVLWIAVRRELEGADALLLPTAPRHPTIAEVAAEPVAINALLGTYTSFCNLLDLAAVSVPAGEADGAQFGVTVMAPAFADRVAADVARMLVGGGPPTATVGPPGVELVVWGAHRSGQPLNRELTDRGARLLGPVRTAAEYRLYRLDTDPPRPGLARVEDDGASIEGELWSLPPAGLASFMAGVPAPLTIGRVRLADGTEPFGFLCEAIAIGAAEDITDRESWPAYLSAR
jgi:allophanate hydrolase